MKIAREEEEKKTYLARERERGWQTEQVNEQTRASALTG